MGFEDRGNVFGQFKVLVTKADGSTESKTLSDLGITEINLEGDATEITLPDGSRITAQTTFTRSNGTTGTVADTVLMAEADGHHVVQTTTTDAAGTRTVETKAYDAGGNLAYAITSVTSVDGLSISNSYDDNGDGVVDRLQTVTTVVNGDGSRTETLVNKRGNTVATAVLADRTVTTTSADGTSVTIQRDTTGGGWFDQVETRLQAADNSRTNVTTTYARDGVTIITRSTETVTPDGKTRTDLIDADGNGSVDTHVDQTITFAGQVKTTTISTLNGDSSLRQREMEVIAANGHDKVISRDHDGNNVYETVENLTVTLNGDGSRTSVLDVRNADGSKRTVTSYQQSADTLSKTISFDLDSDADLERTTTDVTTLNVDGSRLHEATARN